LRDAMKERASAPGGCWKVQGIRLHQAKEAHRWIVGAENLRHQAIFVNRAPGAIAPPDPELIQIRDAVGQLP
jgi:hypothetical protein